VVQSGVRSDSGKSGIYTIARGDRHIRDNRDHPDDPVQPGFWDPAICRVTG